MQKHFTNCPTSAAAVAHRGSLALLSKIDRHLKQFVKPDIDNGIRSVWNRLCPCAIHGDGGNTINWRQRQKQRFQESSAESSSPQKWFSVPAEMLRLSPLAPHSDGGARGRLGLVDDVVVFLFFLEKLVSERGRRAEGAEIEEGSRFCYLADGGAVLTAPYSQKSLPLPLDPIRLKDAAGLRLRLLLLSVLLLLLVLLLRVSNHFTVCRVLLARRGVLRRVLPPGAAPSGDGADGSGGDEFGRVRLVVGAVQEQRHREVLRVDF
jgi:hypothetical protein